MSGSDTSTSSAQAAQAGLPAPTRGNLPMQVTVVLPPEAAGAVKDLAQSFSVAAAEPHALITYGQGAIGSFASLLDEILSRLTNAQSPELFELFRTIRDGVKDADLQEFERSIRAKLKGSLVERMRLAIGLGDPAARLKQVTDEVRGMLQGKAKSLADLIRPMERQIEEESGKLIGEVSRMSTLAQGYRDSIVSLGVFVEAGHRILAQAEADLTRSSEAARSGHPFRAQDTRGLDPHGVQEVHDLGPLRVQDVHDLAQKVDLFRNRLLVLETAYAKAPADLDWLGNARGATLADTLTSANAEFNDVKSVLIRLHALFQMQSVQQMNAMRRELRASLQQDGLQVLDDVSVGAAKASDEARLADAELVLGTAQRLRTIADKVVAEGQRYAAARARLEQARQLVIERPIAS